MDIVGYFYNLFSASAILLVMLDCCTFLPQFGKFKNAIEEYCQKEHMYHNHQGNVTFIPGLSELPYNIFGFIDDSIDRVCVPFLGPDGD